MELSGLHKVSDSHIYFAFPNHPLVIHMELADPKMEPITPFIFGKMMLSIKKYHVTLKAQRIKS
jgi:hypothetical protein